MVLVVGEIGLDLLELISGYQDTLMTKVELLKLRQINFIDELSLVCVRCVLFCFTGYLGDPLPPVSGMVILVCLQ